jgi:hypothetical protein
MKILAGLIVAFVILGAFGSPLGLIVAIGAGAYAGARYARERSLNS